ncbi:MAG: hypothetical protein IIC82_09455, partial [Chloroflexi bacterium]|nr:hypothetical protein [Chloroflexota bacterium]
MGLPLTLFNDVRLKIGNLFEGQSEAEARAIAEELLGERVSRQFAALGLEAGDFGPDFAPFTQAALERVTQTVSTQSLITLDGLVQSAVDAADAAQLAEFEKNRNLKRERVIQNFRRDLQQYVLEPIRAQIAFFEARPGTATTSVMEVEAWFALLSPDDIAAIEADYIIWHTEQEARGGIAAEAEGGFGAVMLDLATEAPVNYFAVEGGLRLLVAGSPDLLIEIANETEDGEKDPDEVKRRFSFDTTITEVRAFFAPFVAAGVRQRQDEGVRRQLFRNIYDGLQATLDMGINNLALNPTAREMVASIRQAFNDSDQRFEDEFVLSDLADPMAFLGT